MVTGNMLSFWLIFNFTIFFINQKVFSNWQNVKRRLPNFASICHSWQYHIIIITVPSSLSKVCKTRTSVPHITPSQGRVGVPAGKIGLTESVVHVTAVGLGSVLCRVHPRVDDLLGVGFLIRCLFQKHCVSVPTSVLLSLCRSQKRVRENKKATHCLQVPLFLEKNTNDFLNVWTNFLDEFKSLCVLT